MRELLRYPPPTVRLFQPSAFPNDILNVIFLYICTRVEVEMITPGGEKAFEGKMVDESIMLG